jgi:transcriptional regulator with XRE-family HTH domain
MEMRIDRVKFLTEMARREWRQKHIVEITGLSRATISAISCGKTASGDTALKIANAFNMPIEQLIELKEK